VAEQPDLLLVQDALPMVSGVEVVREVRRFAPVTRIGAHVEHDVRIAEMLDAGASRAWSRRVPPSDVTGDLLALLQDVPSMSGPAGDSHASG
jgi:DNA-binding response OmpR family regulator